MAKSKLKFKEVENAGVETGEKLLSDGECLYLRVRPESKTWMFIYRTGADRRKLSIGTYPTISISDAREEAEHLRKQLAAGIDPREERLRREVAELTEKAQKEALPQTIEALFDLWQERGLKPRMEGGNRRGRKDGGEETRRKFVKDVFPAIGKLPPSVIRRAHVIRILDDVKARGAPRIAGVLLTDLRQMFTFAVDREIIDTDPLSGMTRKKFGGMAGERDRVLSEAEIKQLQKVLPKSMGEIQWRAIWIMLATCCRIGEITRARWADVDLEATSWTIPPENSKNGNAHLIDLSQFALEQFKALRTLAEESASKAKKKVSPWVMPARHNSDCVCSKSLAKQVADRQRGSVEPMSRRSPLTSALILKGGKWTPHDLRRTGATMMGALGVRPDVVEKCLNHTEPNKLKRIYQRAELRPEMSEAWRVLGDRLELLMRNADNVTTISRAKKSA